MRYSGIRKPKFLLMVPVLVILLIAVACGDDATPGPTPGPTPTPIDVSAITSGISEDLQKSIADALAGIEVPDVVSEDQIRQLVEGALAQVPEGLTAADVETIVDRAVTASAAEAVDQEDVARAIAEALAQAQAAARKPLSAFEISRIVREAIPATPTPAPTATPIPAPDPRALLIASRYGGTVPMSSLANPRGWDPHAASGTQEIQGTGLMFNQIVEYNPINLSDIIGDLAESWNLSDDGLAYTFKLHDGIKWWDGNDLTADDVVFSLNRMMESEEPRPRTGRISPYIASVEKVSRLNVKINLTFPSGAFLQFLAMDYMKIVPKHHVETGLDFNTFDNARAVGSGPFKGVEFAEGVSFKFEKNQDYFKEGRPYFDGIQGFFIGDKGAEIAAFKTGRVLMNQAAPNALGVEDLARLGNDPSFSSKFGIYLLFGSAGEHLLLNVNQPPFDDDRVRRALFLALDRQAMVDGFGPGTYKVGTPMFAPTNPFALPEDELFQLPGYRQLNGQKHPDDIAEAKSLLEAAGFGPDNPLSASFLTISVGNFPDAAQVIKEQFKESLNVDLDLQVLEFSAWIGRIPGGDYQMGHLGYGPMLYDPDDRFSAIYLKGPRNWSQHEVEGVRALFDQQQVELDPVKRKELVLEMQRLVLNDAPGHIEIWWKPFGPVVSRRIKTEAGGFVPWTSIQMRLKHEHEWLDPE